MAWQDDMLAEARKTNSWLRILALPTLRERLAAELSNPRLKRVYQASDGRQTRQVAAAAKVGIGTVHRMWQEWAAQGLLEPTDVAGRFRRIIDLKEVGLEG